MDIVLRNDLSRFPVAELKSSLGQAPMGYLLEPVAEELCTRMLEQVANGETWCWVGLGNASNRSSKVQLHRFSFFSEGTLIHEPGKDSLDGIVINIETAWTDFGKLLIWCFERLKPGGHLLFSTFGPDTLFQLREAWEQLDMVSHLHDFADLQVLGDQMMRAGFERPILDSDWLGVEYEDLLLLFDDLRKQKFQNLRNDRRKTLTGRSRFQQIKHHFSNANPLQITYEIIYGYAKKRRIENDGIKVDIPVSV